MEEGWREAPLHPSARQRGAETRLIWREEEKAAITAVRRDEWEKRDGYLKTLSAVGEEEEPPLSPSPRQPIGKTPAGFPRVLRSTVTTRARRRGDRCLSVTRPLLLAVSPR